jgi:hypothetical protein
MAAQFRPHGRFNLRLRQAATLGHGRIDRAETSPGEQESLDGELEGVERFLQTLHEIRQVKDAMTQSAIEWISRAAAQTRERNGKSKVG